jgi:hypothetical protein
MVRCIRIRKKLGADHLIWDISVQPSIEKNVTCTGEFVLRHRTDGGVLGIAGRAVQAYNLCWRLITTKEGSQTDERKTTSL